MRMTGSHQNTPRPTNAMSADSTTTLSASGSRKAPDRVVPWRRASQPSTPSVHESTNQNPTAGHEAPPPAIIVTRIGMATTRAIVMALAGVAKALGPKPVWAEGADEVDIAVRPPPLPDPGPRPP